MAKIKIQRNFIERTLMFLKDYIKKNRKVFFFSLLTILLAAVFIIAGIIIYEKKAERELIKFEQIMEDYKKHSGNNPEERIIELHKTVKKLNKLIESSYWGHVKNNGFYMVGGLCYSGKMYKESKKYYLKFVQSSPSSFFAPLALQQAARSAEITGDFEEAFKLYKRLESEYGESEIADQIYYDLGRIYREKGDIFKAKEYYNKVIVTYPQSLFSGKAKKEIFLLSYKKKVNLRNR